MLATTLASGTKTDERSVKDDELSCVRGTEANASTSAAGPSPAGSNTRFGLLDLLASFALYDDDPARNPKAGRYRTLSFDKVLDDRLGVMDATAIVMCRDNGLPLRVFNLMNEGDLLRIVDGEDVGTLVANGL